MNQNDLYLKYAEIIKMCKGTALEDKPWLCVKFKGTCIFDTHPRFGSDPELYKFALAILEDRAVFVGDEIYYTDGSLFNWELRLSGLLSEFIPYNLTWQPPKPKRMFTLNGVELPCPVKDPTNHFIRLGICLFSFNTEEDADLVVRELTKILTEERDKP